MSILGLHHITLVTRDAQRNLDFYAGILGLRFAKQTVNFDDPTAYHLYYGDATGSPGSAITFFEWTQAPRGQRGIGGTHHLALAVKDYDGLLKWKRRLTDFDIKVEGPYDRHYFKSIYFNDPDGVILEIATMGPGFAVDEDITELGTHHLPPPADMMIRNRDENAIAAEIWSEPIAAITADMALMNGMHHITVIGSDIKRTDEYFSDLLGLQRVKMTDNFDDPNSAHWYWGVDNGKPGSLITYFERDPSTTHRAQMGYGLTHHFAFAVKDVDEQFEWRNRFFRAGYAVSDVKDRDYFRSIYSKDPDGHIVELATVGPGFSVDEDMATLGQTLQLPAFLEAHREQIQQSLKPLVIPEWVNPLATEGA